MDDLLLSELHDMAVDLKRIGKERNG
jgi:hypothetical protein